MNKHHRKFWKFWVFWVCGVMVMMAAWATAVAAEVPTAEHQISAAVLAGPASFQDGAKVLGYNEDGELVTLRAGENELICLADNPSDDSFSVACYHQSLEPFMARGRELIAQGVTGKERQKQREKEVDEGKISMPREPRTLYVTTGTGFDPTSGEIEDEYTRWVLYVPYAQADELGLPTRPSGMAPWLMGEGTAGAHIMITPPRPKKE